MKTPRIAPNRGSLRNRVRRFVDSELFSNKDVGEFIDALQQQGGVAIFGGLLRDLALWGGEEFYSDIDLVVDNRASVDLDPVLERWRPTLNAFGGYRCSVGRWVFDFWPLESTWAFRKGLVAGQVFRDLLQTTFFNWDAIVYDLSDKRLIVNTEFLRDLSEKRLSINLGTVANELSATVRTLRLLAEASPKLEPSLASFLYERINRFGLDEILWADAKRNSKRLLTANFVGSTAIALRRHQLNSPSECFSPVEFQGDLPL